MALLAQVRESLWGLGVPEEQLRGLPTNSPDAMKAEMRRRGIDPALFDRANALADWRADPKKSYRDNFSGLLRAMGVPADQVNAIITGAATGSTRDLIAMAGRVVSPQAATNMAIKLGLPQDVPQGAPVWNPFRGDAPPGPPAPGRAGGPQMRITGPTRPEAGLRPGVGVPPGRGAPADQFGGLPSDGGTIPTDGGVTPTTTPVEKPLTPEERRARIEASYGWAAGLVDIPEIQTILNDVANGTITGIEADHRFKASNYYKTTAAAAREWKIFQTTDPADAKIRRRDNFNIILNLARAAGMPNIDQGRLSRLNEVALAQGWTDAEVKRALASEVRYDPTGAKTGVMADLKNTAREWLVPLSDAAMTTWAQGIVGGTQTLETFTEYLRTQAKSLFPAMGTALDDPEMTTRIYMDPYAQDTAKLLGVNAEDIDWMDPKFMRAFNQIDPKTGQRTVMTRSDWLGTLMKDPLYGFDKTAVGQKQKQDLTMGLMEMFGFPSGGGR